MAPSESIVIAVRKKFRPKITTFTKCLLDDLQFTPASDAVNRNVMKAPKILTNAPKRFLGQLPFPPTDLASVYSLASHWMCKRC